ncbi:hypothetical protein J3458_003116 [Metarhizium acridum]|uniref:uncharacterized protein n=1 Tax=Metarhizium acridum TaxID=92637 RepID=UPI001C6B8107|nr:hypothetical protein J3458_003116 [Metarhizium acridum]
MLPGYEVVDQTNALVLAAHSLQPSALPSPLSISRRPVILSTKAVLGPRSPLEEPHPGEANQDAYAKFHYGRNPPPSLLVQVPHRDTLPSIPVASSNNRIVFF